MSSEGTDNKGKRKRPESPSQEPTSRESKDMKIPQRQSARIELQKEKPHRLDLGDKFPKENTNQHLQVPVEPHERKVTVAHGPTSTSHPDNTLDDLGNFRMFVRDSRDEAELAVYVGLQNKCDLRHFALSWPVIKTWIKAPHKQTHSLKVEINHLVQDGKELHCIEDPYEIWPQRSRESEEHTSLRLTHIMAWHLVRMSKDIEEYIRSSDLDNLHRTRRYRGELSAMLELDIPLDNIYHPRPRLISWRNELNDAYDRCWSILGYIPWIPYMKSWEKALGFLVSSENNAITYDSGMPIATRPRPNHLRLAQQCSSSSPGGSTKAIPPIQVKVTWDKNENTHRNADLCRVLTAIAHEGKLLPPTDQMMTQDPRLCRTAASFRDIIRHMMSCGGYGLNLYGMKLSYRSEADICYYQIDAFRSQWKVLHGVFSDPANSNFVIRVLLDVHEYRNGEIYETTELPPVY